MQIERKLNGPRDGAINLTDGKACSDASLRRGIQAAARELVS